MANIVIRGYGDTVISSLIVRGYTLQEAAAALPLPSESKAEKYLIVPQEDRTFTASVEERIFKVNLESRLFTR